MTGRYCVFLAALVAMTAQAQVRCTMPNGRVIEQQLSQTCPAGAVSGVTFDGRALDLPKKPAAPLPKAGGGAAAAPSPAGRVDAPNEFDQARALCSLLRSVGATTCNVETSWLKESVIDATLPTAPADARAVCDQVKLAVRSRFHAIRDSTRGWRLQIYHPFGNGTRPMASCPI